LQYFEQKTPIFPPNFSAKIFLKSKHLSQDLKSNGGHGTFRTEEMGMHEVLVKNEGETIRGAPHFLRSMPMSKKDYDGQLRFTQNKIFVSHRVVRHHATQLGLILTLVSLLHMYDTAQYENNVSCRYTVRRDVQLMIFFQIFHKRVSLVRASQVPEQGLVFRAGLSGHFLQQEFIPGSEL
jgi:hypothetical protein